MSPTPTSLAYLMATEVGGWITLLGAEVAKLVELQFVTELKKSPSYKVKDYDSALKETFLNLDTYIDSEKGRKLILDLSKKRPKQDKKESSLQDLFTTPTH